jgi:hypothetical protein
VGSIPAGNAYIGKSAPDIQESRTNQNKQMPDGVSFGESSFVRPDDGDTFSPARIRRFSQPVLNPQAWFCTADELIGAMDLVEPQVERF